MANPFNTADGNWTGNGAAKTITLGFYPAEVTVTNETDQIVWYWNSGLSSTLAIKLNHTGPAISITSNSDISGNSSGFTVSSAANINAKVLSYVAIRRES